jgi:hypothetical protein
MNRELDELEREDFTRLKMVKKKKEEAIKKAAIDAAAEVVEDGTPQTGTPASAPNSSTLVRKVTFGSHTYWTRMTMRWSDYVMLSFH